MHTTKHDEFSLRSRGGLLGKFEGITCDVCELNNLVPLIMMSQYEETIAKLCFCSPNLGDQIGIRNGR